MGIRFFCPNGHKLNVKTELGGMFGFCPKCQARMFIPAVSTRKSGDQSYKDKACLVRVDLDVDQAITLVASDDRNCKTRLIHNEFSTGSQASSLISVPEIIKHVVDSTGKECWDSKEVLDLQEIFTNPTVLWYVHTGEQEYGPATGNIIQTWLRERRIGPKMLIWRNGWSTWHEAENVFGNIESFWSSSEISNNGKVEEERGNSQMETHKKYEENLSKEILVRQQKKVSVSFFMLGNLVGISLLLLGALFFILFQGY